MCTIKGQGKRNSAKEEWPEDLKQFLNQSSQFSTLHSFSDPVTTSSNSDALFNLSGVATLDLNPEICRGMNPKKQHEVSRMSSTVAELCKLSSVNRVVDVGSGLGYLGQALCSAYGLHVLGLESKDSRTHGASAMADKKVAVQHELFQSATFELDDNEQSFLDFHELLTKHFSNFKTAQGKPNVEQEQTINEKNDSNKHLQTKSLPDSVLSSSQEKSPWNKHDTTPTNEEDTMSSSDFPVCMVGLHCCADLTPTMVKLFCESSVLKCMLCLGCCYHNMSQEDGTYRNFPLSQHVKDAYSKVRNIHPTWQITQYALRLAAQETRSRWKKQTEADHSYHTANVAYRALLEVYCHQVGTSFHKLRRRVARKNDYRDFSSYINAVFDRTDLEECKKDDLFNLYHSHSNLFKYIEPFTCLQVILQQVLENLILLDRLLYLKERNLSACLIPLFDDSISPRNIAIVACK